MFYSREGLTNSFFAVLISSAFVSGLSAAEQGAFLPSFYDQAAWILKNPSGKWRDQRAETPQITSFHGKWTVASIAYSSCPSICAMTVETLKRIEASLGPRVDQVEFLLFSIDPQGDTPQAMKRFLEKKGVRSPHWHFISGPQSGTREIAALLGMRYGAKGASPKSHIMHSFRVALISPDGKIVSHAEGTAVDELIQKLK